MNCENCKSWHPIRHASYYRRKDGVGELECYALSKAYEWDALEEPADGEEIKIKIWDGTCDIIGNYVSDSWDGVTVSKDFGCIFFEQKENND